MNIAQVLSVLIFLGMFALIIQDRIERCLVTLGCALLMMVFVFGLCMHSSEAVFRALNLREIFTSSFWIGGGESSTGVNWATIFFIAGMMIMVEGMARSGFFRWLCMVLARTVHYKVIPLFAAFMILSAVLSMFIDSITVILFLAAVTVELAQLLKTDPVPMILAEIFCANLGGSATMSGDPPNIIIGTALDLSFFDFLVNTGFIALLCMLVTVPFYLLIFRKALQPEGGAAVDPSAMPTPESAVTDRKGFRRSTVLFLTAVVLLVTHSVTHLTVATIGVVIGAGALLCDGKNAGEILRGVDYKTLLFFVGLFIVVSGLEETGILTMLADLIAALGGGHLKTVVLILVWFSAVASAFIDNIPFAATMVPVIQSLAATAGMDLSTLAWALSMGTDIGGSATPIGASANVVGISVSARNGHPIGWGRYCRSAAPATVLVLVVTTAVLFIRYC